MIGGTLSESPEQAEKNRMLDADFERKGANYDKQKDALKEDLYGDFDDPDAKEAEVDTRDGGPSDDVEEVAVTQEGEKPDEAKEKPITIEDIVDDVHYPILQGLAESGQLDDPQILTELLSLMDDKTGKLDIDGISEIEGISDNDKGLIEDTLGRIPNSSSEDLKVNIKEFEDDFANITDDVTPVEEEAYRRIARNYIKIDSGKGEEIDTANSFSIAINTAANEILRDYKNIPKDTVDYENAIGMIRGDDPDKHFEGLNKLYQLAGAKVGMISDMTTENIGKTQKKQEIIAQYRKLNTQLEIAKNNGNEEAIKITEQKIRVLISEANELDNQEGPDKDLHSEGEMYVGTSLDTINSSNEA